jgi:hypothetical protein
MQRNTIAVSSLSGLVFGVDDPSDLPFLLRARRYVEWRCFSLVSDERRWDFVAGGDGESGARTAIIALKAASHPGTGVEVGILLWKSARMRLRQLALDSRASIAEALVALITMAGSDVPAPRPAPFLQPRARQALQEATAAQCQEVLEGGIEVQAIERSGGGGARLTAGTLTLSPDGAAVVFVASGDVEEVRVAAAGMVGESQEEDEERALAIPEGIPGAASGVGAAPLVAEEQSIPAGSAPSLPEPARVSTVRKQKQKRRRSGLFGCCAAPANDETVAPPRLRAPEPAANEQVEEEQEVPTTPPMRPMLAIDSSDSEIDAATPLKVNSPARTRIRERATQMRQAVHRFEPTTPGDLGLEVGDLVVVTEGDDSKAWWRGYLQGDPGEVVGDFPFNYTEDVDDLVGAHMELDAVNFEMRAHVERRA